VVAMRRSVPLWSVLFACLVATVVVVSADDHHSNKGRRCDGGSTVRARTSPGSPPRHWPAEPVAAAAPLWKGDSFAVKPAQSVTGGARRLSPYLFSSASASSGGWFQEHSNSDPSVHGVTVVDDPLRLCAGFRGGVRKVIKITADERRSYRDRYVRVEIRGPTMFGLGNDRWVISEIYIPPELPTLPNQRAWWTILSIFGPPYGGASPNSFHLKRNVAGTDNDLAWDLPNGEAIWRRPATRGVWHIIARRIRFHTDPRKGFSEVWYSRRGIGGDPTGPLRPQMLGGSAGVRKGLRRYYSTLEPGVNWNGHSLNHPDLKNYHTAKLWRSRTFTSLYFARHRVYNGATPVRQIDPFYTRLR
jgi:hypothetical protein